LLLLLSPMTDFRQRLDEALVARGLAQSRARARDMIRRGVVMVDGALETRPARRVADGQEIAAADPASRYVSRAALKLVAGLDAFGFDPRGRIALDLGASTGGFTQVLIERGAALVIAVDVGRNQLAPALAADPRIRLLDGLNARDLSAAHLPAQPVAAIVADLSFISLKLALPPALTLAAAGAWGIFLVKPQFEVGPAAIGKGGIVRDPQFGIAAAEDLANWLAGRAGWRVDGLLPSPILGADGNQELLLGARRD
jgi:23S rRNA (cytidine1920-2'-O)/16S rRNA (cytidine1409-2'-O)-methyltransferase